MPLVIPNGLENLAQDAANPLPQALVLTAIVIGFALLCYALVLGARLSQKHEHGDVSRQQTSEPAADPSGDDPHKPPVMEDQ